MFSFKNGSKERKQHIDQLRKRGNFFNNICGATKLKPVRRPNRFAEQPKAMDYLPCKFCFGLFKKNYLRRHLKKCTLKKELLSNTPKNIQADAQSLLLAFTDDDTKLVDDVFPRMAPDEISMVVKADPLIRAFGSRYLKCHKEKHLITVVSNKMRELGRYLMAMQKSRKKCQTLLDCLVPEHFDEIINSTKTVAGYNATTDKFEAPSLVLKIGTSLKQCCDIAEYMILKKSPLLKTNEDDEKSISKVKTTEKLIKKQWSFELSTNASKEIYQRKWNKPAFLPLTSDIKIFRDYLLLVQQNSLSSLKADPTNTASFKALQESVLAQLILLNRKRAGEVQRIFLETYLNCSSEAPQEEMLLSLSEVERELSNKFKRLVIRGKRGRGVPILFTPKLQKSLSILISLREKFCVKENEYLFAVPNTPNSCVRASDVLRRMAVESGAKNPASLTSTKLRKQIATVAQLLSFNEGDVEQLANFMGHSKEIHKTFYRLPENVYQVAKVSKFLLMMEKGDTNEYRGKNLNDININIDGLVSEESDNNNSDLSEPELDDELIIKKQELKKQTHCGPISSTPPRRISTKQCKQIIKTTTEVKNSSKLKKKFDRIPWTDEQRKITVKYFQKHILLKKPPKKGECEDFIKNNKTVMTGKLLLQV